MRTKLAREVIQNMYSPTGRACKKGGVRKVLEEFKSQFYCKGIDGIVRQILKECHAVELATAR